MSEMQEMMMDQLRDAISAEKQAIQGMKRMQRKTTDQQLRGGIEAHVAQSKSQAERVQQLLEMAGGKGRKVCQGMRGLVEEAQEELGEHDKGPLLDLVIVAALQRVEHYEIAAYGTMAELAKSLGQNEAAEVLAQILEEEKAQDMQLTELTRASLMQSAMEAAQRAEEEGEQPRRRTRRSAAASGSGRGRGRPAAKSSARGATKASGRGAAKTSGRGAAKSGTRGAAKSSGRSGSTRSGAGKTGTGTRSGSARGRSR